MTNCDSKYHTSHEKNEYNSESKIVKRLQTVIIMIKEYLKYGNESIINRLHKNKQWKSENS